MFGGCDAVWGVCCGGGAQLIHHRIGDGRGGHFRGEGGVAWDLAAEGGAPEPVVAGRSEMGGYLREGLTYEGQHAVPSMVW